MQGKVTTKRVNFQKNNKKMLQIKLFTIQLCGGGGSGLSYGMAFDQDVKEEDYTDEQHGIQILVSQEDAPILQGTKIDFKQSLMGGGFTIDNPNAIANCGDSTIMPDLTAFTWLVVFAHSSVQQCSDPESVSSRKIRVVKLPRLTLFPVTIS